MSKNLNNPLVSIIIPVFNGADYLNQAIESALEQTYGNIEIVVVNDGSRDQGATENIALSYGHKISYYSKTNGGVATALNFGIEKMKGEYFSWLSHDDLYTADKIETQISSLAQYDDKTILYSNYSVFKEDPLTASEVRWEGVPPQHFRYWITVENCLHGCTLLIPKTAFEEHGLFDPNLRTTQDYAMWFNMARTYKFIHVPQRTVFSRMHPNQGSISMSDIAKQECDDLIKGFIAQLSTDEIIRATKKNIEKSYLEIAQSCEKRRFMNACNLALELRDRHKTNFQRKIQESLRLLFGFPFLRKDDPINNPSKVEALKNCDDLKLKFSTVYRENLFGGRLSKSGEGSDHCQTRIIQIAIPEVVQDFNIRSFLDAPCGDWYWMQKVILGVEKYIGADIVPDLINQNAKKFEREGVSFQVLNLVEGAIPQVDLVHSRDCLVHLSFNDSLKIIRNFKTSGSKYLLMTTFTNREENLDLGELFWRPLNMQKYPFHFPEPIRLINEGCTEENNEFSDKCLGLWLLRDINC